MKTKIQNQLEKTVSDSLANVKTAVGNKVHVRCYGTKSTQYLDACDDLVDTKLAYTRAKTLLENYHKGIIIARE
jgi:hypothetical protein